jgi:hypothetical protein
MNSSDRRIRKACGNTECQTAYADSFSRPLRRRAVTIARPARVRIRKRKPCVLARRRLFGWKVRLLTVRLHRYLSLPMFEARDGLGAAQLGVRSDRSTVPDVHSSRPSGPVRQQNTYPRVCNPFRCVATRRVVL